MTTIIIPDHVTREQIEDAAAAIGFSVVFLDEFEKQLGQIAGESGASDDALRAALEDIGESDELAPDCQDCADRFTCTTCEGDCACPIPQSARCDAHSCADCQRSYGPDARCRC